jgi:hypothetical protein
MKQQILGYFFLCFPLFCFGQETVFVKSNEIGNGIVFERAGECFVITPSHVVSESVGDILIKNKNKVNVIATLDGIYASDLAILRISKSSNSICANWEVSEQFNIAVDNISNGTIEYLDEFGISNMVHVNITSKDKTSFIIIPQNANINFRKGMSGSSFYINYKGEKILAGMLMSMEDDSMHAFVYQIDDILRTLAHFIEVRTKVAVNNNAPKRIGIMLLIDNVKNSNINNQLVNSLNQGRLYRASSEFSKSKNVLEEFNNIVDGRDQILIPNKLKQELDQLFLGTITYAREKNRKNMHIVHANLKGGIYSTTNFNLINAFSLTGKGLGFNELSAEKQALKSLLNNLKNQFK